MKVYFLVTWDGNESVLKELGKKLGVKVEWIEADGYPIGYHHFGTLVVDVGKRDVIEFYELERIVKIVAEVLGYPDYKAINIIAIEH